MALLSISAINRQLTASLKRHLDHLRTKLNAEVVFDQLIIDEIRYTTAWCRTALNTALDDLDAEESRLKKDVFADRVIADVFRDVRGDEMPFPERVYDNIDAVGTACRAVQQSLDTFDQDMRREWEEISKMSLAKRKDFVELAKRKMVSIVDELNKKREECVEQSKRLEEEIRGLQSRLRMKDELEDATEEWHDAQESL